MQLLATAGQMRSFDRETIERLRIPGHVLMEHAGRECARALAAAVDLADKRIVVLCGKGNNGGDGFVIARRLSGTAGHVEVVLLGSPSDLKGEAALAFRSLRAFAARAPKKVTIRPIRSAGGLRPVSTPDVLVDAILGTGFSGKVEGLPAAAIAWANRKRAFVLAVDIPSGVDASTGVAAGPAIRADLTVTFGAAKVGHFVGDGCDLSGRVEVADIGIPEFIIRPVRDQVLRTEPGDVHTLLPARDRTAHKYSVGKVLVIAGSRRFTGAPVLASLAALRSGCGAVILGVPASVHPIVARKAGEVIVHPLEETSEGTLGPLAMEWIRERLEWADAAAIGPGLGRNDETDALVRDVVVSSRRPVVLDADGLTAFSSRKALLRKRKAPVVLTPHAGELSRLIGTPASEIELDRVKFSRLAAKSLRCTVVLKGAPTAVAEPDGRVVLNPSGNPGMATIGSGDVLTGLIASLIAQGVSASDAAWAGAYLHGVAGDIAREKYGVRGLLASDILAALPETLREARPT